MYEEHEQLDHELARLAESLRTGDHMKACLQLADFALRLDDSIYREERALAFFERLEPATPTPLPKMRTEHTSMRRLIGMIANALDRADDRRGLEVIGKLRSVLLLHLEKERTLEPLRRWPA